MGRKLSITAFVLSLLFFIPFLPIVGMILGIIAVIKAKNKKDLKKLAIAAIIIGAIISIFTLVYFFHSPSEDGLKINSLNIYSAMPTQILSLDINIPDSLISDTIKIRFADDQGYKVDVPLSYYSNQAIVPVPIYFTDTGDFNSGIVNVSIVADSGDKEYISNEITGFEIQSLPTVKEQPGTITLAYLTKMIEKSDSTIAELDKVNINNISTTELRQALVDQKTYLVSLKNNVNSAMKNPAKVYVFGNFNGQDLKLDNDTLAITDRIFAAYFQQYKQNKENSGITGNAISDVNLDSFSTSFEDMYNNIRQGIITNQETMTSTGEKMMGAGGVIAMVNPLAGAAVAGVGAVVLFTGLNANTAFLLATDASITNSLNPYSTSGQVDMGKYLEDMTSTGLSEVDGLTGSLVNSISLLKKGADYLNKFNKDIYEFNGINPEDNTDNGITNPGDNTDNGNGNIDNNPGNNNVINNPNKLINDTYALLVTKLGDGAGTIMSYPPGISCPGTCSKSFPQGIKVTLGARIDSSDSSFSGWQGGDCSGTGDCIVYLDKNIAVSGTFSKQKVTPPQTNGCICSDGVTDCTLNHHICKDSPPGVPGYCACPA